MLLSEIYNHTGSLIYKMQIDISENDLVTDLLPEKKCKDRPCNQTLVIFQKETFLQPRSQGVLTSYADHEAE